MYCLNGTTPGVDNQNTNAAAVPLYKVAFAALLFRTSVHRRLSSLSSKRATGGSITSTRYL